MAEEKEKELLDQTRLGAEAVSSLETCPLTRDRKILEDSATTLQLRPQSSRCRESLRGVTAVPFGGKNLWTDKMPVLPEAYW